MIVVDTSLLSVALRRAPSAAPGVPDVQVLRRMIQSGVPPGVPGIVVQEILSGVKTDSQFAKLSRSLESLPVLLATASDHVLAATLFNTCQGKGVAATVVDCLIAAQAISIGAGLWTLDRDFVHIARVSDLTLFRPGASHEKP